VVKLDLPAIPQLRTGMFGRALFAAGAQRVAAIPTAALVERGQLQAVFVVEDGTAHSRLVTTGRRAAGESEILSGLNEGERVVSPVPPGLQDGARVEVRQ
jgi:membrane fusion protein, multidrug efflux system